jgi:hypothetical protein
VARLIDAEALREWLLTAGWYLKGQDDKGVGSHVVGKIIDHIDSMPTVAAVPVDWLQACIKIAELFGDERNAGLLMNLIDLWHRDGYGFFEERTKEAE